MTIYDLENWSIKWCQTHHIKEELYSSFVLLSHAYAEKEFSESYLTKELKKFLRR